MTSRVATLSLVVVCLGGCCLDVVTGKDFNTSTGPLSTGASSSSSGVGTSGSTAAGSSTGRGTSSAGTSSGSTTGPITTSGTTTGHAPIPVGPCTGNDQCTSGICGVDGTGNCCTAACERTGTACSASGCDAQSGACAYPGATTVCGGTPQCDGNTLEGFSVCDGKGDCLVVSRDCPTPSFCDAVGLTCCTGLAEGGAISVDNATGADVACCGFGGTAPCQTLERVMQLVDEAHARRTAITATVNGQGGDWTTETYPVTLGWGVELIAPGVFFDARTDAPEIFDINPLSNNDTVGFVSISGTSSQPVWVGLNSAGGQSLASSSIHVESQQRLNLTNATVASNQASLTTAITVEPTAALKLGENESGFVTGTVNIGYSSTGWNGITCVGGGDKGCLIFDAKLFGATSVQFQGMNGTDLVVPDFSSVSLHSAPIFGVEPGDAGFQRCPSKFDASSSGTAIIVTGNSSLELWNGQVQCIDGTAISLEASSFGAPSLDLEGMIVRNTGTGLYVSGGKATVKNTAFIYNAIGVIQDGTGIIDLVGLDSIACNSGQELGNDGGGIDVLNESANDLDAEQVLWDGVDGGPADPDLFSCDSTLTTCTCLNTICVSAGGTGTDMEAVQSSTGTIDTSFPQEPPLYCNQL